MGLRFSYFEGRYTFLSWLSLKEYQRDLKLKGNYQTPQEVALRLMEKKIEQFLNGSEEIINSYNFTNDLELKYQIIQQYQKSLHRIINDALEINAFELIDKAIQKASFNDEMNIYIKNKLLLDRLKLIQYSGSYKLYKIIKNLIN